MLICSHLNYWGGPSLLNGSETDVRKEEQKKHIKHVTIASYITAAVTRNSGVLCSFLKSKNKVEMP